MNVTATFSALIGFILLFIGVILFLAGSGIISIKQWFEIQKGKGALYAGGILILIGIVLVIPGVFLDFNQFSKQETPISASDSISTPTTDVLPSADPAILLPVVPTPTLKLLQLTPDVNLPLTTSTFTLTPPQVIYETPAAVVIVPKGTRTVSNAENQGSCGPKAFDNNLATKNPVFKRPSGHVSGWIGSDPASVVLPDGTIAQFPTQFMLLVDDLSLLQIQNIALASDGNAILWGCWFLQVDTPLVTKSAMTDYQNRIKNGSEVVVYRVDFSGLHEIDPIYLSGNDRCLAPDVGLGKGYSGFQEQLNIKKGYQEIYSHCPATTTIKYDEIIVDDELEKIQLVCEMAHITDIEFQLIPSSEQLLHYTTEVVNISEGCRFDFYVKDNFGGNIQITIKASTP